MILTDIPRHRLACIALMLWLTCPATARLRIVILGSSTAEGAGCTRHDSCWVERFSRAINDEIPETEVINLAKGGYTTYQIMPTGSPAYQARRQQLVTDTCRNITKALSLKPDIIIINMPTNDTSHGIPVKEQLNNFKKMAALAKKHNADCYVTTAQPHNFGEKYTPPYDKQHHPDVSKQHFRDWFWELTEKVKRTFKEHAINFYDGIASDDSYSFIKPEYDSGDGVHLNNNGHRILAQRAVERIISKYKHSQHTYKP